MAEQVIAGIAEGCRQAGCALIGGETAEMPGMYAPGHYDLAGFAVGAVERTALLDGSAVQPGDVLVGLPSTGIHSNGYSLARKLLVDPGELPLDADVDGRLGCSLGEALLAPTRIYSREIATALTSFGLKAAAHITGGGIPGNVPRVLPEGCGASIERGSWPEPPIFGLLREAGALSEEEMLKTFNAGLGMVLVVPAEQATACVEALGGFVVGHITDREGVSLS